MTRDAATLPREAPSPPSAEPALAPSPYLHVSPEAVHDPTTDRLVKADESLFGPLYAVVTGATPVADLADGTRRMLIDRGWLLDPEARRALDAGFFLKYVQLEAHTVCNQSCYFCPVSVAPREPYYMPMEDYRKILGKLTPYKDTIEAVFMIAYNEPTADKRFIEQVRTIREFGLPPATLTNGSGLTRDRVDELVELGGLRFLSINLSTMDRQKYREDRGKDQLELVMRHLEYAKDKPVGEQMDIVVLGPGDDRHQRDYEEISDTFRGSRFTVKHFVVNDRAGLMQIGLKVIGSKKKLRGCDLMGSRPTQHLHINPHGDAVLCCQDYHEVHKVGNVLESSIEEVMAGDEMQRMRRMIYGLDTAPADFICRNCPFAITD
jgi:MoaA/NifB/PqqE/SkfB family radical SAM enzyme